MTVNPRATERPSTFTQHRARKCGVDAVTVDYWPDRQRFSATAMVNNVFGPGCEFSLDGDLLTIEVTNGRAVYRLTGQRCGRPECDCVEGVAVERSWHGWSCPKHNAKGGPS